MCSFLYFCGIIHEMKKFFLRIRLLLFYTIIFITFTSCRTDSDDEKSDTGVFRTELSYSGDVQNWNESLQITAVTNAGEIVYLTGVNAEKTEKKSNTEYVFHLPESSPQKKGFQTTNNVKMIALDGNITALNQSANELTVSVKVYKDNILKFEYQFVFNKNSNIPYYSVNVM